MIEALCLPGHWAATWNGRGLRGLAIGFLSAGKAGKGQPWLREKPSKFGWFRPSIKNVMTWGWIKEIG